jgi:mono/diheme cytochrome c family protein
MKDVKQISVQENEPSVRSGATFLSMWVLGLLGALTWWAFVFVDAQGGQFNGQVYAPFHSTNQLASFLPKDETVIAMQRGKQVYAMCTGCHQDNGLGNPTLALPLAGSEWVTSEGVNRLIRIPLKGVTGPFKAAGKEMNAAMLAIGADMTDQQVADVLTYIRNSWGNKAPLVTPEQVAKIRAEIKDRTDPYTQEELLKLPEVSP